MIPKCKCGEPLKLPKAEIGDGLSGVIEEPNPDPERLVVARCWECFRIYQLRASEWK